MSGSPGMNDGDDDPVYRSLPAAAMFQASSMGSSSGATFRELPISSGLDGEAGGLPSYSSFNPMTTSPYNDEPTVYRSLMVAPPLAPMSSVHSAHDPMSRPVLGKPKLTSSRSEFQTVGAKPAIVVLPSEQQEPIPQAHPFHLEAHCWFIVKGKPVDLVAKVDKVLAEQEVDFTFKASKCKWKGRSYLRNNCLDFRVVLFHGAWEPDMFVVEFQRRQGCAMQFAAMVRKARAQFVRMGVVCTEAGVVEAAPAVTAPSSPRDTGFFPPALAALPKPALTAETLAPVVEMACSEFADVQSQALREIANLAGDDDARRVLVAMPGVVERLVRCAASPDRGLHRCAAAALSNFAVDAACHAAVVDLGGVESLLTLCAGRQFAVELEAQRKSAECLARLAQGGCAAHVAACGGVAVFTDVENKATDARLKAFASAARVALSAC